MLPLQAFLRNAPERDFQKSESGTTFHCLPICISTYHFEPNWSEVTPLYCREDLYAFIYDKLKNKCCENPSGIAFEIKENARKGVYARKMPIEIEDLLLECDVPEWYVESMKKIRYMFPKTHMIINLKHDICEFIKYEKGTI